MTLKEPITLTTLLLVIVVCLACNDRKAQQKHPIEEHTAIINLSAVTNASQIEVFNEVRQASRLPTSVLNELGGMADPGQPFNATCVVDPGLPMRQLIVAAVSERYFIVSYWSGGLGLRLETTVFELSEGVVKREWVSIGGGFNFRDLKDTIEVGDLLQFRQVPVAPGKFGLSSIWRLVLQASPLTRTWRYSVKYIILFQGPKVVRHPRLVVASEWPPV